MPHPAPCVFGALYFMDSGFVFVATKTGVSFCGQVAESNLSTHPAKKALKTGVFWIIVY